MGMHTTGRLAYWHMPKTGGFSVYRVLRELCPGYLKQSGPVRHSPLADVDPALYGGKLLFGTARDPWSWYASLYQHAASGNDGLARLKRWGEGDPSFKAVLRSWTQPTEDAVGDQFGPVWGYPENQASALRQDFLACGLGLYSWMFNHVYGAPALPQVFIPTLNLEAGLADITGLPLEKISVVRMQNKAQHRPKSAFADPRSEFDNEMLDWVEAAEDEGIPTFGWQPFKAPDWTTFRHTTVPA